MCHFKKDLSMTTVILTDPATTLPQECIRTNNEKLENILWKVNRCRKWQTGLYVKGNDRFQNIFIRTKSFIQVLTDNS